MLRKIRTGLAIVFFAGITLLFLDFTGTWQQWFGWMARMQFLPALLAHNVLLTIALLALTALLGRLYCSIVCPMGVLQDVVARLRRKKNRYSHTPERPWVRYGVLALFVGLMLLGLNAVAFMLAPYSAYGRIAANLFAPLYALANNGLAAVAERADSYAFYAVDIWARSIPALVVAALTLAVVGVLAWRGGRTYCNTICPVGTVLGLVSKASVMRVSIDTDKCNGCGLCARNCKSGCIDPKAHRIDASRCVVCFDCIDHCRQRAIAFSPRRKADPKPADPSPADNGRRQMLATAGALLAARTIASQTTKLDGGLAVIEDKQIPQRDTRIVPAGALSIRHLERHCTGSQLCVAECPNGVLRPSSDLQSWMQPHMSYERGYCRPECTRCSQVCPNGAIGPIGRAEKSSTQIGHAVWISRNCIPLTDHVACGNCARHCPAGAISMIPSDPDDDESLLIPSVDTERCIGCGACENLCPARPFSAIYVEGHEVHRTI